jgi:hypothetical protein
MKYKIENLNVLITPKAEKMKEFEGIGWIEFDFPKSIKTILFIHCGYINNRKNGDDCYEVVGRLYESNNPKETGEDHIGKLYIYVYNHPDNVRYKTFYEQLEWRPDGSFYIVTQSKEMFHIKPRKK